MKAMDLEKVGLKQPPPTLRLRQANMIAKPQISAVMDRFETQFEDLDVATGYYENATSQATAVATPQEDVDRLMNQVADEAGVELHQDLEGAKAVTAAPVKSGPTEVEEDGLGERLRALRS